MININHIGNFSKTERFLKQNSSVNYMNILEKYGNEGVMALASSTPSDSGATARSWNYNIITTRNGLKISWTNSNIIDGVPIAVIIQYGHATRNGGYVQGIDYINPTLKPIFNKIAEDVWKEVTKV